MFRLIFVFLIALNGIEFNYPDFSRCIEKRANFKNGLVKVGNFLVKFGKGRCKVYDKFSDICIIKKVKRSRCFCKEKLRVGKFYAAVNLEYLVVGNLYKKGYFLEGFNYLTNPIPKGSLVVNECCCEVGIGVRANQFISLWYLENIFSGKKPKTLYALFRPISKDKIIVEKVNRYFQKELKKGDILHISKENLYKKMFGKSYIVLKVNGKIKKLKLFDYRDDLMEIEKLRVIVDKSGKVVASLNPNIKVGTRLKEINKMKKKEFYFRKDYFIVERRWLEI